MINHPQFEVVCWSYSYSDDSCLLGWVIIGFHHGSCRDKTCPHCNRLCAIEALMHFGAAAKKHSTSIMSVLEDDVYLVRLLLGR